MLNSRGVASNSSREVSVNLGARIIWWGKWE